MKRYKVTGMSCAACQARVEKAVSGVTGVTSCSVSLLTNTMGVEGTAADADIISAVREAGYGAGVLDEEDDPFEQGAKELKAMRVRLISSVIILLILMYFTMGHMMIGLPVPEVLHNGVYMGILQMVLTVVIMVINRKYFISGIRAVRHLNPNMDTLIATGSGAAFVYSAAVLIAGGTGDYYFESASMILTLVTVGKTLEQYSRGKTGNALKALMKLAPDKCTVIRGGVETVIDTKDLAEGETVVVRPGESFPCDGIIIEGESSADESLVTGESMPVDKTAGDNVISASINLTGMLRIEATRVGRETTLSQIIAMVSEASATKAPVAKLADRISSVFVPAVMAIAVITFAVWMMTGKDIGFSLARAISVLVVSCPCALGLATPVAIMVGSGLGAKHGILFKTAGALQETGRAVIAALDKTGTVTTGVMTVTDISPAEGMDRDRFIMLAAAAESGSEHPVGKAVAQLGSSISSISGKSGNISGSAGGMKVTDFKAHSGFGITAEVDGHKVAAGNASFISRYADTRADDQGGRILFAVDGQYAGSITVADTIKNDSAEAVRQLKGMGIYTVMITGDNEDTAARIGKAAGVDKVCARVLPSGKANVVEQLRGYGKCIMTGDGINDAPALTSADTGIAIGAGADVAIDSADVVLISGDLKDLAAAVRLSRATYRNILQNLFWALFYNVLLIPAACGIYSGLGITMTPALGACAMSISSVCVVVNALRLNLTDIYDPRHDRRAKQPSAITINYTEVKEMVKTMKINGMMCGHCEARVKKTLEALDGVTSAQVSHEKGEAVVTLASDVPDDVLRNAVTEQDYEVVSIS